MEILLLSLGGVAFVSILGNVYLFLSLKQSKKKPVMSRSAADLLHDLTARGGAVVRVSVIDPEGLLIHRG